MLILDGLFSRSLISIGIWLLSGLYSLVSSAFRLFLVLAQGKVVNTSQFSTLMNNIYVIIGVVMLFILSFALLRGMVNTEDKKQGASTIRKVIINLITSSLLVILLPTVFDFAYDFQDSFLHYNVIGKLFGYSVSDVETGDSIVSTGANRIANGVYTAFFYPVCSEGQSLTECQEIEGDSGRTFNEIVEEVNQTGRFSYYSEFADLADEDAIDFHFFLSLFAGGLLIYVAFSFCFDMALRMIKLIFYQLIAPMPIFLRVIPDGKLSGTFNNWVKVTLTCYLEVYVRILVFYFCIYLFNAISASNLLESQVQGVLLLLAKAFIIMGIVMFMKQAPKLFSEVTGLNSGNMKLGIRDKLKEGGLFTAGAALGSGVTALTRNASSAVQNYRNKFQRDEKGNVIKDENGKKLLKNGKTATIGTRAAGFMGGLISTTAGAASGFVRGAKAGLGAKNEKDMISASDAGAKGAVSAREKRANYKASHGGTFVGSVSGHVSDVKRNVSEWAGIGLGNDKLEYFTAYAKASDTANSAVESTYKNKQEYIEQNNKVKALKTKYGLVETEYETLSGKMNNLKTEKSNLTDEIAALTAESQNTTTTEIRKNEISNRLKVISQRMDEIEVDETRFAELKKIKTDYLNEEQILDTMRVENSMKKKDNISLAATKLSVDQKVNYSNNSQFQSDYKNALLEGYKVEIGSDGEYVYKGTSDKVSEKDKLIIRAMLNGEKIDSNWIEEENVKRIQDAIDEINKTRQHTKSEQEKEFIYKTGNRSTEKKDK